MKKIFLPVITAILMAITAFGANAASFPQYRLIIPSEQGMSMITGIELIFGNWCEIGFVDDVQAVKLELTVPGFSTPFTYKAVIDENSPDDSSPNYNNTLTVLNVMYDDGDKVKGYWQLPGTYVLTIPANTLYAVVDGQKVQNPELKVSYRCSGNNGGFMEEAKVVYPAGDVVTELDRVVVQFPTSRDNDGWQAQLLSETGTTVNVPVTLPSGEEVIIPSAIATEREQPNRVTVKLSQFTERGEYVISFPAGLVFEGARPYATGKKNPAQSFTIQLVGEIIPDGVTFNFSGVNNAWQLVSVNDVMGFSYAPTGKEYFYEYDPRSEDCYATLEVPVAYNISITGADGQIDGVDYVVDYGDAVNSDDEQVNYAQITFLSRDVLHTTFNVTVTDPKNPGGGNDNPGDGGDDNPGGGEDNPGDQPDYNGVGSVSADANGVWTVYTLQGVKVLTATDASALDALAPGIYIINGSKVVVK